LYKSKQVIASAASTFYFFVTGNVEDWK